MPTTQELLAQRKLTIGRCRAIVDQAEAEKRGLTAEERKNYDAAWTEVCQLKDEMAGIEEDGRRRAQVADALADIERGHGRPSAAAPGTGYSQLRVAPGDGASASDDVRIELRRNYATRPGVLIFKPGTPGHRRNQPETQEAFARWLGTGVPSAALQTDLSTAGGYMVAPEQFVAELLKNVDDIRWIRRLRARLSPRPRRWAS